MISPNSLRSNHRLAKLAARALVFMDSDAAVPIYLISESEMRRLNREFRGKDCSTNVLAFPFPSKFPQHQLRKQLGEIYLNPDYIKRHGESLEFMLIHGLLHLLGFNHIKKGDRIKMEAQERKLFRAISER